MDTPLEIAFHNMDSSSALEARVRERADKLHRFFRHINSCRVVVEVPHRSPSQASRAYHVRIEVRVPDRELVVSRDPGSAEAHLDSYLAVRDAFDAMERQLEHHSQKVRGDVKTLAGPLQGRVLRLFSDYGFIATTDGREIYFHKNAVVDPRFEDLSPDTPVELAVAEAESPAGPQASTVRAIGALTLRDEPTGRG
ncbi:MAG: HPF/RaiA family ribosome-associated protein [Alphaproteobacteria bacterium]|nr:HPF/RaiA family ribosome-associated protein [Alphaproteobacteria bacterium]